MGLPLVQSWHSKWGVWFDINKIFWAQQLLIASTVSTLLHRYNIVYAEFSAMSIVDSVFCVQILLGFQKMNCVHAWCKVYVVQSVFEHVLDYIQSVCSTSSACCLKCIFIQCMHSVQSVFACLCILTLYAQYCMHGGVTQHLGCRLLWIGPGCQFLAHCYFTLSWWDR